MSVFLDNNPSHIQWLCNSLALGEPVGKPTPVAGGFHHRMWRLDTNLGRFAIKQLGEDAALSYVNLAGHYNATEAVAKQFAACGFPALYALDRECEHLQLRDGEAYLVYPWTTARAVPKEHISELQACRVASIMAQMHSADIDVPGLGHERPNWLGGDRLVELVQQARRSNVRDAGELESRLEHLVGIADAHPAAIEMLSQHRVVSHGDLDHKNVLWTEDGEPVIIDWESARRLNPTHELLLGALDWSGITSHFELGPFRIFLSAYRDAGGAIDNDMLQAAFHCVLADWVNWLMYNVGRALEQDDPVQHSLGSEQVDLALSTILRIEKLLPRLLALAVEQSARSVAGVNHV